MDEITSDNLWGGQIVLISDDPQLRALYIQAIELLGGHCMPLAMEFTADSLDQTSSIAAIVIHITEWGKIQETALGKVEDFCEGASLPLLIRTNLDLLDFTLAAVAYPNVEHLLSDSVAELFVSLEHRTKQPISSLFADRDKIDLSDLKNISIDVERVAKALVRLSATDQSGAEQSLIDSSSHEAEADSTDSPVSFKPMPSPDQPFDDTGNEAPGRQAHPISATEVRGLIKARRLRDEYFDSELFADPAWDMLLDLMASQIEGTKVSVSSLCIAANVPPTTALRWIKSMTREKIFVRKADQEDGRRIFIEMSDETAAGMDGFFAMIRRSGLMLI